LPLCCDHFLLRHWHRVKEGLHRGLAEAPTSLMWPCLIVQRSLRTPTEPSFENCCTRGIHGLVFGSVFKRAHARAEHIQICAHSTRRLCTVGQDHATSSSDRRAIECTKNRQCSLNHLSDFEFVGRHIAPLLLALRSRADSVAQISKFFRPFKEPPVFGVAALHQEQMDQEACPTA
jgi:hypothetical protein